MNKGYNKRFQAEVANIIQNHDVICVGDAIIKISQDNSMMDISEILAEIFDGSYRDTGAEVRVLLANSLILVLKNNNDFNTVRKVTHLAKSWHIFEELISCINKQYKTRKLKFVEPIFESIIKIINSEPAKYVYKDERAVIEHHIKTGMDISQYRFHSLHISELYFFNVLLPEYSQQYISLVEKLIIPQFTLMAFLYLRNFENKDNIIFSLLHCDISYNAPTGKIFLSSLFDEILLYFNTSHEDEKTLFAENIVNILKSHKNGVIIADKLIEHIIDSYRKPEERHILLDMLCEGFAKKEDELITNEGNIDYGEFVETGLFVNGNTDVTLFKLQRIMCLYHINDTNQKKCLDILYTLIASNDRALFTSEFTETLPNFTHYILSDLINKSDSSVDTLKDMWKFLSGARYRLTIEAYGGGNSINLKSVIISL